MGGERRPARDPHPDLPGGPPALRSRRSAGVPRGDWPHFSRPAGALARRRRRRGRALAPAGHAGRTGALLTPELVRRAPLRRHRRWRLASTVAWVPPIVLPFHVLYPAFRTSTRSGVRGQTLSPAQGVTPTSVPPMSTVAPEGSLRMRSVGAGVPTRFSAGFSSGALFKPPIAGSFGSGIFPVLSAQTPAASAPSTTTRRSQRPQSMPGESDRRAFCFQAGSKSDSVGGGARSASSTSVLGLGTTGSSRELEMTVGS